MSQLMLNGEPIAGGGLTVVKMTEAQYLANKTALDSSDILVMITDVDPSVADGESVVYNSDMNFEDIGNIATKAIAKVEPSDTALYLHPVGSYFINKDGNYCITDVLIQAGGTIALGTNCHVIDGGISSNLSMHSFGTAVDLKNVQTPYTIPSDGYLHYSVTNGTSYFLFLLNGLQVVIPEHSTRNTVNFISVRQGMEIRGLTNPEAALAFEFLPLV